MHHAPTIAQFATLFRAITYASGLAGEKSGAMRGCICAGEYAVRAKRRGGSSTRHPRARGKADSRISKQRRKKPLSTKGGKLRARPRYLFRAHPNGSDGVHFIYRKLYARWTTAETSARGGQERKHRREHSREANALSKLA